MSKRRLDWRRLVVEARAYSGETLAEVLGAELDERVRPDLPLTAETAALFDHAVQGCVTTLGLWLRRHQPIVDDILAGSYAGVEPELDREAWLERFVQRVYTAAGDLHMLMMAVDQQLDNVRAHPPRTRLELVEGVYAFCRVAFEFAVFCAGTQPRSSVVLATLDHVVALWLETAFNGSLAEATEAELDRLRCEHDEVPTPLDPLDYESHLEQLVRIGLVELRACQSFD